MKNGRKKRSRKQIMRLFVFEGLLILGLALSAYFISLSQRIGYEKLDEDIFIGGENQEKIELTLEQLKDAGDIVEAGGSVNEAVNAQYRNILLVGVDARDQSMMTNGANADVLMLVNINENNGEVRLVSILRDTLLRLVDGGKYYPDRLYDKANAQNCYTGISDTVSMLNMNLDLNIEEYVVVNWAAAAQIIDTIGGIEMTIENEEILKYLNGYLTEVNEETGIFAPQIKETGTHLLTGTQAVAFSRIRYAGLQDLGRTANQRELIVKVLDKMKHLVFERPTVLMTAVNQAAGSIVTNMTLKDIGLMAFKAGDYTIVQHTAFPFDYVAGNNIGKVTTLTAGVKDFLVANDLEKNVILLHQYLYGDVAAEYTVPSYVKQISEDISWMTETN